MISLISSKERWHIAKMVGFTICSSVLEIATAVAIIFLTQVIATPSTGQKLFNIFDFHTLTTHQTILFVALLVGFLYLIKNIIATLEMFFQHSVIQKMNYRFQKRLLEHYLKFDYDYYLTRNASQGFEIITSDSEAMFSSGMTSLSVIFSESLVSLCLIATLFVANPMIGLIIFGIGGLFGLIISKKVSPLFYFWGQGLQQALLLSNKHLLQFFHGFKEIILLGKQRSFVDAYHIHSKKKAQIQAIRNTINTLPRMATELLFVSILILTIAYFCFNNISEQAMMAILGGYLYAGFRLMPGLNRIIMQLNIFKSIIPSIERVFSEYHLNPSKNERYIFCPDFKFNNEIILKNVSYKYISTHQYALKNISLNIRKGECIGIIGKTGSGKSTLSDVLLGLLSPEEGIALIDNQYPLNSVQWHQQIGYVHQAIYLIDDTIQANIAFGESLDSLDIEKLNSSIKASQLNELIERLPEGINTLVGERGIRLSGGERQRIAIARALYRNPSVLIFDEATSALDNETERLLMETIHQIHTDQRTIIIIAHRLTTLQNCERIIVMKNGSIDRIIRYEDLNHSFYDDSTS